MKKQSEYKFGFSLIELSIVILMIGILIGGVTKGIAILDKSKISSAISLTTISPVARIPNLVAWYETTLPSSFFSNTLFDGSNLVRNPATGSHWNDNSPEKNNNINTAPTGALTYIEFGINNLPAVNFPGTALNSVVFNVSRLSQKYYTVFVVERRSAATSTVNGVFLNLGGDLSGSNSIGYLDTNLIGNDATTVNVGAFSGRTPRIVTVMTGPLMANMTKGVFVNGGDANGSGSIASNAIADDRLSLVSAIGYIGRKSSDDDDNSYSGDIAEVIIYNRTLTLIERNNIQQYLSKKYKINVVTSI